MLLHPTLEKLRALKLPGMARALEEQQSQRDIGSFTFEERLGLLLDHESTLRDGKVLAARLSRAKLKLAATPEDVDFKAARGLDKTVFMALMDTSWVTAHRNVLITGPTGVGKTYLACAIANQTCRRGHTALYLRMTRLFPALALAKASSRYFGLALASSRCSARAQAAWPCALKMSNMNLRIPFAIVLSPVGSL